MQIYNQRHANGPRPKVDGHAEILPATKPTKPPPIDKKDSSLMPPPEPPKDAPAAPRTSGALRDMLFDELEALRSGRGDVKRANAVAKMASAIVETVRMEIDFAKHRASLKGKAADELAALTQPLKLGR